MVTRNISFYAVLGVSRDADPVVIEAAYRALMRKYHPDRTPEAPTKAAEINVAYSTLRDPKKRREYDEQFRASQTRPAASFSTNGGPQPKGLRRARFVWLGLGCILAIAIVALVLRQAQSPSAVATGKPGLSAAANASEDGDWRQPISPKIVRRAVSAFNQTIARQGFEEAVVFSKRCFEAQALTTSFNQLVFCAAYDDAAAATPPVSLRDEEAKLVRFAQRQLLRRQIDAATSFSQDVDWIRRTLAEISRLTLAAQQEAEQIKEQPDKADPAAEPLEPEEAFDVSSGESVRPRGFATNPASPNAMFSAARARAAQQAAAVAAQDWAKCAATQFHTNVRSSDREGAADGALRACAAAEHTVRAMVRSALEARSGRATPEEVERNMDAARAAIRGALVS
jgi:hypothetical protein